MRPKSILASSPWINMEERLLRLSVPVTYPLWVGKSPEREIMLKPFFPVFMLAFPPFFYFISQRGGGAKPGGSPPPPAFPYLLRTAPEAPLRRTRPAGGFLHPFPPPGGWRPDKRGTAGSEDGC